ncbi:16S rRNA (adenine(1518)-N(6)/adenine(1519)-N(6))-dimethyltransferase RsmA [Dialister pneumosintes]|uniref:Ribosomal RNA small subunit methyltransferase A n=1 Tax=Dialister pneumosintes TaxID=39950 RepID=A0ABX9MAX8_9FIRM|nr:16S rRNA (adenine(1518)-N(6)/adenine(1519)-N(6))-dimethyltransferase RsmA [Dialister pneumosintes]MBS6479846.1 16S rRNA (adenine(1518)-N(6)/adenine(1519)-N(6))-dimethyltransferase RsmA [Dialister sp.]RID94035.1 16S rRNA (adenine(1518)-N(6)/adenine(1519)-N(6))-dimethyltransferase RsmA [Dialister pneumosintes]
MFEVELADKKVISYILKRFNIHAKHRLGQNFLVRADVVKAIAEAAELTEESCVLEIGPGIGILTQALARTGAAVTAVEIDKSLEKVLLYTLEPYENINIIYEDILKLNLYELMQGKIWKIAANLPYYITTPILIYLIQTELPISIFVFMMQKEVAARIMASPGTKDYGALTLAIQFYCTAEIVMDVPPSSFIPKPAVMSTVLKLKKRKKPAVKVKDKKLFFSMVKIAFGQRRKVFTNALKAGGINKTMIDEILRRTQIDGTRRGETFSMQEFGLLADAWYDLIHEKS